MKFRSGHSWWYAIYRVFAFFSLRLFYRRSYFKGIKDIPKNAGVILAPNHQSAFMDAFMVSTMTPAQNRYLVRADIFKKPLARKILTGMNMLPIYRLRDGVDSMEKNEQIFTASEDAIMRKEAMVIFPEGNQANKWKLRPLKKGYARIAIGALKRLKKPTDIFIVPVGINYYHFTNYRSQLVVQYGQAIKINDYKEGLEENEAKTINDLKTRLSNEMSSLLFNISDQENYDAIKEVSFLLCSPEDELALDFKTKKSFFNALNEAKEPQLLEKTKALYEFIRSKDVSGEDFYHAGLGKINPVFFPFVWLFSALAKGINAPFIIPLENFIKNKVKDIHFHASLRYVFFMLGYPIIIGVLLGLFTLAFNWGVAISVVLSLASISYLGLLATDKMRFWKLRRSIDKKVNGYLAFNDTVKTKVQEIRDLIA